MDDKMVSYLVNHAIATNKCLDGVKANQCALMKQIKINRKQRFINMVLGGLITLCVCNISDLLKTVKKQNTRIKTLEAQVNGEEEGE